MPATLRSVKKDAGRRRVLIGVYLLLAALTWVVFGQTLGHQFVEYDDQSYVYENPEITAGITTRGIVNAFAHPHARNWHPLTTISHMLDCQLFGLNPAGHHLTNVLLHTAAVLLLFSALHAMTGAMWRSAFVAAVFAIHPLRAESVAWVAERKDVLSALFFMLTLGAYFRYARQASLKRYLWVISFFALGLISKPMLVTLPLVLLLLDYWPLARFQGQAWARPNDKGGAEKNYLAVPQRLIVEKIPLLFLSLLSAIATLIAQRQTVGYSEQVPLTWRLSNGLVSYVAYIGQMIWPAKLAVFYPHAADSLPLWEAILTFLLFSGITAMAFMLRKTRPYLIIGWSWYLICLLPVIGVIQVGLQGRADRYTYLPQIGLYLSVTWAAADFAIFSNKRRGILACLAVAIIGVLAWRAWIQTSYWRNTESLWNHALAVTSDNDLAHNNVAALLMRRGQVDDAISHYEKALKLRPKNRETHYHLSIALLHNNLANALAQKGLLDEAIVHYRKAVELRDDFADAHSNLAAMLAQKGQAAEAIAHYEKALAIPPEDAAAHVRLAAMLLQTGREDEAIAHYRRALEIAPRSVVVLSALAWVLATSPNVAVRNGREAVALAQKASQLSEEKNPAVLRTLAASYAESGRFSEAVVAAQRALRSANDPTLVHALEGEITLYGAGAAYTSSHEKTDSASKR
jgi:tetratricopeptide (TPR) repeat protein